MDEPTIIETIEDHIRTLQTENAELKQLCKRDSVLTTFPTKRYVRMAAVATEAAVANLKAALYEERG